MDIISFGDVNKITLKQRHLDVLGVTGCGVVKFDKNGSEWDTEWLIGDYSGS